MQDFLPFPQTLLKKAKTIRLLALDVDGVLTDGRINMNEDFEFKSFFALDGFGLVLLGQLQLPVVFVTASKQILMLQKRADKLGVKKIITDCRDEKKQKVQELLPEFGLEMNQMAFCGDDVFDIPLLDAVGLSLSVPNAHPFVKARVDYVTNNQSGKGAVREIADLLLIAHGFAGYQKFV